MDSASSLIDNIDEAIYQDLKSALELGRWQSGKALSDSQKPIVIQAIIAYENKHMSESERTGYIHKEKPTPCESHSDDLEQEQLLEIRPRA